MALALDPPLPSLEPLDEGDSPYCSALAYSLTEYRHPPRGRPVASAAAGDPDRARPAKTFGWKRDKICDLAAKLENHLYCADSYPALRPHQLAALAAHHRSCKNHSPWGWSEHQAAKKSGTRRIRAWNDDVAEGRDLAGSLTPLPSDADRAKRPPSLERQEAFRDAKTAKRKHSGASTPASDAALSQTQTDDDAELYRLGLLYDDEHERGPGFDFNAITHVEPAYTLSVRPGRGRKRKADAAALGWYGSDEDVPRSTRLPLDLSFAALGDDEAIAQFLMSPDASELVGFADAGGRYDVDDDEMTKMMTAGVPGSSQVRPSLRVIYEMEGGDDFSFDEDIGDKKSAADDAAEDDSTEENSNVSDFRDNTQSLADRAAVPAVHDFPDLVPDTQLSGDYEEEEEEDDDDDSEWAYLPGMSTTAHVQTARASGDGEKEEEEEEEDQDATNNDPDTWIVLG